MRNNIKSMAQTTYLLTEKNLWNLDSFDRYKAVVDDTMYQLGHELKATQNALKEQMELLNQAETLEKTKENYQKYKQAKDPEKFLRKNYQLESDIILYGTAKQELNDHAKKLGIKSYSKTDIINEINRLETMVKQQKSTYSEWKEKQTEYKTLEKNLQMILDECNREEKRKGKAIKGIFR